MKESELHVTIGVDPGINGGLGVLINNQGIVYDVPKIKTKVKKRTKKKGLHEVTKTDYDLKGMWEILQPFSQNSDVIFAIERVGVRPADAKNAMFNFGQGVGFWKGMAIAAGFEIVEVSPQAWKKHYPNMLEDEVINDLRESIKALRAKKKIVKDKKEKSSINKDISKLNRQIKTHAKDRARSLAAELWPDIEDCFKLKKDDGKAEGILLAKYAKETRV